MVVSPFRDGVFAFWEPSANLVREIELETTVLADICTGLY